MNIGTVIVNYTKDDLKQLIINDIESKMPQIKVDVTHIHIETKSTQNYKSTWEQADFRAAIEIPSDAWKARMSR